MNVDKFGHHVHKRLRVPELIDSDKVLKLENGEFNLRLAKLKGVKSPSATDEAVNKEYVDKLITGFCTRLELANELKKVRSEILLNVNKRIEAVVSKLLKNE